ncbi:cellulose binding domain-containing protein [Cellvibrio sp. OA-2007]|uniref:cellulose binding domain-containing protein n=1 Tax=Cellvibrio sp. OA-2007 TaxID=529823 RepID=UPI0007863CA2|nr:cellulose binding domain-containing protein [Cellvibrio sp. OA-2007]
MLKLYKAVFFSVLSLLSFSSVQASAAICSYTVDKEWSSGYNATVTITNNGATNINGWSLSIKYATNTIASFYSATITGSNPYTATNVSYNSNIAAGGSVSFGYKGLKNGGAVETPILSGGVCGATATSSSSKSSVAPSSSSKSSVALSSSSRSSLAPTGYTGRFNLPGRIEAEKYNNAYDLSPGNSNPDPFACTYYGLDVDVAANADGCLVGWTSAGETLDYAIGNADGRYDVSLRVASRDAGKRIKLLADGKLLGTVTTSGGGWSSWELLKISSINIASNTRLTVEFVDGATNIDYIDLAKSNSDVPQPPSSCSNADNGIPQNIKIHTILDKSIERPDFPDFAEWYTESGNTQRFQLHEGNQNTTSSILRPRVEAYATPWTRSANGSTWHEFSANYYLSGWDKAQRYAIFQIKTNDASNFIIQGLIAVDGSLEIARRGKGTIELDTGMMRKPFNLRVRSNGFKFEVWYNCTRVIAEDHPQPTLESNASVYGWRWGLYRQEADDDKHDGTTTLYVTGAKFN